MNSPVSAEEVESLVHEFNSLVGQMRADLVNELPVSAEEAGP